MTEDAPDSVYRIHTGQRKLRNLFFETVGADKHGVVYTLKERDHEGFPSLYRLYMEVDDPTEYTFATQHLDSWDHWETLCECNWFKPYVSRWRRELEIRTKAKALVKIKAVSESDAKEAYQAHKFLVSMGWREDNRRKGAGRPSKEEVLNEAKRQAQDMQSINDDLARVQGTVN